MFLVFFLTLAGCSLLSVPVTWFVTNDPKAIPVNLELVERFTCSKCDASFGRIHALYDHFDAKHKGIVYPCPKCMKHYTRSSVVSKHIQANHATTCHICHVESVDKVANQRHIETSHRVYKCKKFLITFHFIDKSNLFRHSVHFDLSFVPRFAERHLVFLPYGLSQM